MASSQLSSLVALVAIRRSLERLPESEHPLGLRAFAALIVSPGGEDAAHIT